MLVNRREMLKRAGAGFGLVGLAGAMHEGGLLSSASAAKWDQLRPHFAPKAKRVLFLFMNGAPSHVDTFDPKPALKKHEGEEPGERPKAAGRVSAIAFQIPAARRERRRDERALPQSGQAGRRLVRDPLDAHGRSQPRTRPLADALGQHPADPAVYGFLDVLRPGQRKQEPAQFRLPLSGLPVVGPQLWSNSFLPGEHQGMAVDTNDMAGRQARRQHPPPGVESDSSSENNSIFWPNSTACTPRTAAGMMRSSRKSRQWKWRFPCSGRRPRFST
jgi:hypothetical protein